MTTMGESSSTPRGPDSRRRGQAKSHSMPSHLDTSPPPPGPEMPRRSVKLDNTAQLRSQCMDVSGDDQRWRSIFSSNTQRIGFSDDWVLKARVSSRILNDSLTPSKFTEYSLKALPILFIVVPGCADLLFKDGSRKATDLLLLLLSAMFLYLSCTKPWGWYALTQEIKVQEEPTLGTEPTADRNDTGNSQHSATTPETPKETGEAPEKQVSNAAITENTRRASLQEEARRRALAELRTHEVLSQILIFASPLLAALFVHSVGNQLARPQGLVPPFGLKVFVVAAQVGTVRHVFKLLKARTVYLQRIVPINPYLMETVSREQLQEVTSRLADLEERMIGVSRMAAKTTLSAGSLQATFGNGSIEARLAQNVRNTIQPELDALNRAVRRCDKRTTALTSATEERFSAIDGRLSDIDRRLDDAISLSAVVARNTSLRGSMLTNVWAGTVEMALSTATLPLRWALTLCMVPVRGLGRTLRVEVMEPGTQIKRVRGVKRTGR